MTNKSFVYVGLRGGLGNQLFSLSSGYLAAVVTGSALIIDGRQAHNQRRIDFNKCEISQFNLSPIIENLSDFKTDIEFSESYRRISSLKVLLANRFNIPRKFENLNTGNLAEKILQMKPKFFLSHYEYTNVPLYAQLYGFPTKLELLKTSDVFNLLLGKIQENISVAIHVRLGDFVSWKDGEYLTSPNFYSWALKDIKSKVSVNTEIHFFLFSDDSKNAIRYLPKNISYVQVSTFQELNSAQELYLMSKCDYVVTSKSTFSWWAGFWKGDTDSVYSPHNGWRFNNWKSLESNK